MKGNEHRNKEDVDCVDIDGINGKGSEEQRQSSKITSLNNILIA